MVLSNLIEIMKVAPDGKIVVLDHDRLLYRFLPNGTPDPFPAAACVARYDASGALDRSFGTGGTFVGTPVGSNARVVLQVSSEGAIAEGLTFEVANAPVTEVLQLTDKGVLKSDTRPTNDELNSIAGLAFDAGGGLLVSGDAKAGVRTVPAVNRYVGRALDPAFGAAGRASLDFSSLGHDGDSCVVAADPQGGAIVDSMPGFQPLLAVDHEPRVYATVNGWVSPISLHTSTAMTRLTPSGAADASFAQGDGVWIPGCTSQFGCNVSSFARLGERKFLVARKAGAFSEELVQFSAE